MMAGGQARGRSAQRGARRAEGFRVRRWLQVGVASAGVSAALLGLSPMGIAVADDSDQSSSSSTGSAGSDTGGSAGTSTSAASKGNAKDAGVSKVSRPSKDVDAKDADAKDVDAKDAATKDAGAKDAAAKRVHAKKSVEGAEVAGGADDVTAGPATTAVAAEARVKPSTGPNVDHPGGSSITTKPTAVEEAAAADVSIGLPTPTTAAAAVTPTAALSDQPWVVSVAGQRGWWQQAVAGLIATVTSNTQSLVDHLPLPDEFGELVMAGLWAERRAFLNQAPVVAPVPISTQSAGPITGRVEAVDPEGDPIVYRLGTGPTSGTVQVDPDGTYTYTPGSDFDGFDTFTVIAQDVGWHVNLLDPFRADGARVRVLVNQGGITFAFHYTTGSQYWSPDARAALQSTANSLTRYFLVTSPVTLTYDVTGENSMFSGVLASAGSGLTGSGAGFFRTVVQNKLLSGVDSNGSAADGQIDWNFGYAWGLGDSVGAYEYDFTATVMHELMHSFGFLSNVDEAGSNTGREWTVFDSFISTADGTKAIGPGFSWNSGYDGNLTGGDGGLYFGGPDAVDGYGTPVPLYTPNPWERGSSMSHLDDATFTGSNQQLMNAKMDTGPGVRVLSPAELGILKDLGYTVVPQTSTYAIAMIGFIFVRRLRTKSEEHSAKMSR